ncbi:dockerin type I repeat-containing protein [Sodaliphilus sp.]|uniref:dockerin type I repeat-containing protein n=1 Tax=Sodaliphilus sp. TaxID=2815818 RepID=UPI00388E93FA
MRIKSLFLVVLACFSLSMFAETQFTGVGDKVTAQNFSIKPGENAEVKLTLERKTSLDFTNIQFDIVFPVDKNGKGLRPVEIDGVYDWAGQDITMAGTPERPAVAFCNNFDNAEFYPVHRVVGVNVTKTAQEPNPIQFYTLNIAADEGMLPGDYPIVLKNLKYTSHNDDLSTFDNEQVVCIIHVEAAGSEPDTDKGDVVTAPDFTIKAGATTGINGVPFTLHRNNGSNDFTNIQFDLIFPVDENGKGIRPIEIDGVYDWAGQDITMVSKPQIPAVIFKNNFDNAEFYPVHRVVGANMTKTAQEPNPIQFYTLNIAADEGMLPGDYPLKIQHLKYTSSDDNSYTTEGEQVVCIIHIDAAGSEPEEDTTDILSMTYALYCNDVKTRPGQQVEMKLNMKNATPVCLWQTDLVLPEGFSVATDEAGELAISISGNRTSQSKHNIAANTLKDGSVRILCSSTTNKEFLDNDGEVATILLNVPNDIADGEYSLMIRSQLMVENNATATTYKVENVATKIIVKDYTLGDVNNDDAINGVDLVYISNIILENPVEGAIAKAADMNYDGVVNGTDYVLEVNQILERPAAQSSAPRKVAPAADETTSSYAIYSTNVTTDANSTFVIPVSVLNENLFTLWQADFELPEGFSFAVDEDNEALVELTGNRTSYKNHSISTNILQNGDLRVLCASTTNKDFKGNDGEVATISIIVDKNVAAGEYVIKIKKGLVVEANGTGHNTADSEITVTVYNTSTVINDITVNNGKVNVFNTFGQLVKSNVDAATATEGLSKGIYIVGNKKVAVRE